MNEVLDLPTGNEMADDVGSVEPQEETIMPTRTPVARARKGGGAGGAREEYLYFVQQGKTGLVLIDIDWNPKRAIADLQLANPEPLRVLAITAGSKEDLGKLHKRFRDSRRAGDWHEATDELMAYVSKIPHIEPTWKPQKRNHRAVAYTLPEWAVDRLAELADGWSTTKSGALQRLLDESCGGKNGREVPTKTR